MLCGDTKEIMRKNSEKGRKFRLLGRNRAEDEPPRIIFKDAAALYIEFSKSATASETAMKRMRFFVQFFRPGTRSLILLSACLVMMMSITSSAISLSNGLLPFANKLYRASRPKNVPLLLRRKKSRR